MIMAGRGKRLDVGNKQKDLDAAPPAETIEAADLSVLKEKINQLNLTDISIPFLTSIRNLLNQLCPSKETTRDVLRELHDKALSEADFGKKLVVLLEHVSNLEVNGALFRGELLTLIQNDFEAREVMCKNDPKKFINAVKLLGDVYNKIKVCGAPIAVLGLALVEYFDLLLNGGEEELKTLTQQILINGKTLLQAPTFDEFKIKLRKVLINSSSNSLTKCWILLIIDLISNDLKPVKGLLHEFYVSNLKDDYVKLDSFLPVVKKELNSPKSVKSDDSTAPSLNPLLESKSQNASNVKKDLTKKFSESSIRSESANIKGKKDKGPNSPGKNLKKDNWKQNASMSEHDDRFVKEENYYGIQTPRQPRSESRKFSNDKSKKKEIEKLGAEWWP